MILGSHDCECAYYFILCVTPCILVCCIGILENPIFVYEEQFNPLKAELNPICHLLVLLGAHHILHVSRIRLESCKPSLEQTIRKGTSMFHRAFFNSIIDKHQHMHFSFSTILV